MTKKELIIIVIAVVIIIIGVVGYFYWKNKQAIQPAAVPQTLTETASQGVLPSINTNPLQNAPDLNPVNKANPYTNVKTNPF